MSKQLLINVLMPLYEYLTFQIVDRIMNNKDLKLLVCIGGNCEPSTDNKIPLKGN